MNHLGLFADAISKAGLSPPEAIVDDGAIHRFDIKRRGDKRGYYVLHGDGVPAGLFGDWGADLKETWSLKPERSMSEAERAAHKARIKAAQAAREKAQQEEQEATANRAAELWAKAAPLADRDGFPYLAVKKVAPHGTRLYRNPAKDKDTRLAVPVRNIDGNIMSLQLIDSDGGKRFLPGGKVAAGMYVIGDLTTARRAVIAEGFATAASIAEALDGHHAAVVAAFNAGNLAPVARAIRKAHPALSIVIAADDDHRTDGNPGMTEGTKAAQAVAGTLAVPRFEGARADDQTDFNDLHQAEGLDAVRQAIETASQISQISHDSQLASPGESASAKAWPELRRIEDDNKPGCAAFPLDSLGPIMGPAARALAEGVQAPDAMAAGAVLAMASLAVQAHFNVQMPHGQYAPTSLYMVTAASSGDRKSALDQIATHPAEEIVKEEVRSHSRMLVENPPKKGEDPPPLRTLLASQGTTQALHYALREQSHIGIFSAEGAEMLNGHSMREEQRAAGMTFFLKAWSGERIEARTRIDGASSLVGRRMSMHLLVQPIILKSLLSDPIAKGNGFLARCLIAQPDSLAGTRFFNRANPLAHPAVKRFHDAVNGLLRRPPVTWHEGDGFELKPAAIAMDGLATKAWIEFYNEVERQQGTGGELETARAFASKAPEHLARIAAVMAAIEGSPLITAEQISNAARLAGFYVEEHKRLLGGTTAAQSHDHLDTLVLFFKASAPRIAKAKVLQYAPRQVRDLKASGIKPLLAELEQRGYIRPDGNSWEVHPDA